MSLRAFLATRYGRGFASRREVEAHQARALHRFRKEVLPRSPFYHDLADQPLEALPRMNKARLMEEFTRINTCAIDRDRAMEVALAAEANRDFTPQIGAVSVGLSTGTSGQRGLFLATPDERRLWAAIMLGRFWPELWRRQRVAFFMRADNALYRSVSNPLVRFEFFDLQQPFEGHPPRLAALDPTVLIAPAKHLAILAGLQLAGDLALRPRRVLSVAETLSPEDEALVREAFGRPVDQVYQATEGVLAFTCKAGRLHLNEAWLRIDEDVIDAETGAFCPVIFDFTRTSLPILNYRLDDVLIPDPRPCPCGCASRRIARIEGRHDDILWWDSARGPRMISAEAVRSAMACLPVPIRDYRVIQQRDGLHLWIEGGDSDGTELFAAARAAFGDLARRHGCDLPPLMLHRGLPAEPDGKRRRIRVLHDASAPVSAPVSAAPVSARVSGLGGVAV
jgi:putative adenylate-forming enzyme